MSQPDEHQFLTQVLRGNAPAVQMCQQLFQISQVLDDLIDRDKPLSSLQVINAFWRALIELPANSFYREHESTIRPLMAAALQDWTDSVQLERAGDAHGKTIAFVLRDQLTAVVVQCAYLIGGYDWMQQVSQQIRRHFHDEDLGLYLNGLPGGVS